MGTSDRRHGSNSNQALQPTAVGFIHAYELTTCKDRRGVDPISDALPFGRLWYDGPNAATNATGYAMHDSRSHDAVIRVYDEAGDVIEMRKESRASACRKK
jgi:hypothetical protein